MIIDNLYKNKKKVATKSKQLALSESIIFEDPTYKKFHRIGRMLAERKLSQQEILDIFAQAEKGMTNTATGANRTALGRGKDVVGRGATNVKDAVNNVLNTIQNSAPVAGVDVAYDKATDALANLTGGENSKVTDSLKKYRLLAKEYPKTQLFVKSALIALAGLATGGAGLPAIAGLTAAVDAAIKGEKLSSIIGKGTGAALMGLGAQKVNAMLHSTTTSNDFDPGPDDNWGGDQITPGGDGTMPGQFAGGQYTIQNGDQLGYIAQANGVSAEDIKALNPHIEWEKPLQPGMKIDLPPTGDGTDSVWQGYTGGVYGDKVAGAPSQATLDTVHTDNVANAQNLAGPNTPTNTPIDYTQPGPITKDSLGHQLEYGIPVNQNGAFMPPDQALPAGELAKQTAAYDTWKADFTSRYPNATVMPDGSMQAYKPGYGPIGPETIKPAAQDEIKESIKFKRLPADQLIDQKLTVLSWSLQESVNRKGTSIHLTNKGVYTVFENIDRYRKAILEARLPSTSTGPGRGEIPDQYRPDMPSGAGVQSKPGVIGRGLNWLDRSAKKVGGALSNFGHQFTTDVTKEKLKMNWHQAGKPSDSDQLSAWLIKQGVPEQVIVDVFNNMGIPFAPVAPASMGYETGLTNPATGKPWTAPELAARRKGRETSAKDLAHLKNITKQAAQDIVVDPAAAAQKILGQTPAPSAQGTTITPTGQGQAGVPNQVTYGPGFAKPAVKTAATNYNALSGAGYNYGGATKLAKPAAPKTPAAPAAPSLGQTWTAPSGTYNKKTGAANLGGKPMVALKDLPAAVQARLNPTVRENITNMLKNVETKEDVQKIKQYIDRQFTKNGLISEGDFNFRNSLLEQITQIAAVRRKAAR